MKEKYWKKSRFMSSLPVFRYLKKVLPFRLLLTLLTYTVTPPTGGGDLPTKRTLFSDWLVLYVKTNYSLLSHDIKSLRFTDAMITEFRWDFGFHSFLKFFFDNSVLLQKLAEN